MSKEVNRYEAVHIRYGDSNIRYGEGCEVEVVTASDYDTLLAERDVLLEALEDLAEEIAGHFDMQSLSANLGMKMVVVHARAIISKAKGDY